MLARAAAWPHAPRVVSQPIACRSWFAAWQLAYFCFKYLRRRIQPAVMVMPPNSAAANAAEPHEDRCRACPICSLMNVRASRICSGCDAPLSDEIDDSFAVHLVREVTPMSPGGLGARGTQRCEQCTFRNPAWRSTCAVCNCILEHAAPETPRASSDCATPPKLPASAWDSPLKASPLKDALQPAAPARLAALPRVYPELISRAAPGQQPQYCWICPVCTYDNLYVGGLMHKRDRQRCRMCRSEILDADQRFSPSFEPSADPGLLLALEAPHARAELRSAA